MQADNDRPLARPNFSLPANGTLHVVAHRWPLSQLNLFPLLDLPCSALVDTRRPERCQTAHVPIFGCVAVLVHSVDSGLMHGTVNKPPKSAILVCKATWWLFVCLILIHTSMFILWTNTSLPLLPFPLPLLSLGLRFSLVLPHCLLLPNTPS